MESSTIKIAIAVFVIVIITVLLIFAIGKRRNTKKSVKKTEETSKLEEDIDDTELDDLINDINEEQSFNLGEN